MRWRVSNLYRKAGGGEAGEVAVREEFDRLKRAAMTEAEIAESFAKAMATGESQATIFNNKMSEVAQTLTETVQPALIALAPALIAAGTSLAGWLKETFGIDVLEARKKTEELTDKAIKGNTALYKATGATSMGEEQADFVKNREDIAVNENQIKENEAKIKRLRGEAAEGEEWGAVGSFVAQTGEKTDEADLLQQQTDWLKQQTEELKGGKEWLGELAQDGCHHRENRR